MRGAWRGSWYRSPEERQWVPVAEGLKERRPDSMGEAVDTTAEEGEAEEGAG